MRLKNPPKDTSGPPGASQGPPGAPGGFGLAGALWWLSAVKPQGLYATRANTVGYLSGCGSFLRFRLANLWDLP